MGHGDKFATSAGGNGAPNRYPCAYSQLIARRRTASSLVFDAFRDDGKFQLMRE